MDVISNSEIEKFIRSLEQTSLVKTSKTILLLKTFGNNLSMPHSKRISVDLLELRVRGKQEIRIFYFFKDQQAILLSGFIKKSNKTPGREIEKANHLKLRLDI